MIAFIQYQYKKYLRSYQFIPPMMIFITWIIIQYLYSGQPILSSYASSCLVLLIISCWLTINILNLETLNEKYLLFIQFESKLKYLFGKLLFIFLVNCILIVFSMLYPILIHSFKDKVSLKEATLAIALHIIVCLTAILISSFIANINVLSKKYKWLLIALIILVSILRPFLLQTYTFLKYILWIVPPIGDYMSVYNTETLAHFNYLSITIIMIVYILVLFGLTIFIFLKSDQK